MAKKVQKKNVAPKGKFEYKGTEVEIFKNHARINGTAWRKIKK